MNIQIFNVIQLISLVELCCQGKSDIAEKYSKQYILSFAVCGNIIVQAGDFYPIKLATLRFVYHCFMDSLDPSFLQKKSDDEDDME